MKEEDFLCETCNPPPPVFDLPPPPRPPSWDEPCDEGQRPLPPNDGKQHYNYETTCDIHSLVIDSRFYLGENLFTFLLIVICSCILVGIIMTVAIVIYRYVMLLHKEQFHAQLSFMWHSQHRSNRERLLLLLPRPRLNRY